ncbi:MAG: MbcA/ParS/Xre antitoxin family protein [Gammaproteobacteria bacterium]
MPRANGQGKLTAGALDSPFCASLSLPLGASKGPPAVDPSALPSEDERLEGIFAVLDSRSEEGQFRGSVFSQLTTVRVTSAKSSPYRGRITGPVRFINQLLDTWHLNTDAACTLLGFEPSDSAYINNILRGYATLRGRDAKDRTAYLFQIRKSLAALFRDQSVENDWLREPQDILNGETPMNLMLEGSMENLLLVKEYVELVAGR